MKATWKRKGSALLALVVFGVLLVVIPQDVFAATERPLAPSSCNAVRSVDGASISVAWTPANKDNAARYVVERRRNKGNWYWAGRAEAPATTFTDDTLRAQDSYDIRVYARRSDGEKSGTRPCLVSSQSVPQPEAPASASGGAVPDVGQSPTPAKPVNPEPIPAEAAPSSANPAPAASGPVPVPACGAYWGSYVNSRLHGGGTDASAKLRAISSVEDQIGRGFDIDHQFYRWDDFADPYNLENYVKVSAQEGRIPFLSWKPVYRDNRNISWKSIADGSHDSLIRQKAKNIKSLGMPVFVSFDHEANSRVGKFVPGDTGGGHIKTDAGSEAEYVAAWRHIHKVFEQQGATNVSWVWLMTRTPFGGDANFADRLYPGGNYVDWVGLDPYNFFHGHRTWNNLDSLMGDYTKWIDSRNINKPWMLGEWGTVEDPNQSGRKADWYRKAATYIESEPRLKAVVHFESKPDFDWRFDSSASSKSGFTEVSNRKHFKQSC